VRLVDRLRVPSHLDRLRLPAIEGGEVVECARDGAGALAEPLRPIDPHARRATRFSLILCAVELL
jgi:hypothetical protein